MKISCRTVEYISNGYSHLPNVVRGSLPCIGNGSLYLIIGSDKTLSATCVAVPSVSIHEYTLQTRQWSDIRSIRVYTYGSELHPGAQYAVFIKGIRISLSYRIWTQNPPHRLLVGFPGLFGVTNSDMDRLRTADILRFSLSHCVYHDLTLPQIPFHVSDIITQIIVRDAVSSFRSFYTNELEKLVSSIQILDSENHVDRVSMKLSDLNAS